MALDHAARDVVEKKMLDLSKYSPNDPWVKRYNKYLAKLRSEARAADVICVLQARGIRLSATQRKEILGCRDRATLGRWLARAARAEQAQDVFAARPRSRVAARSKRPGRRTDRPRARR